MGTPSNLQPLLRATGGSYGLKTFQISIKNFREQQGQKQRKAEGRGKLKAKKQRSQGNEAYNKNDQ